MAKFVLLGGSLEPAGEPQRHGLFAAGVTPQKPGVAGLVLDDGLIEVPNEIDRPLVEVVVAELECVQVDPALELDEAGFSGLAFELHGLQRTDVAFREFAEN